MRSFKPKPYWLASVISAPGLLLAAYVLSTIWRVSHAEQQVFGRSDLIRFGQTREFNQAPVPPYWGQPTYSTPYRGKPIVVNRLRFVHCLQSTHLTFPAQ
jgi:hypothetical protein